LKNSKVKVVLNSAGIKEVLKSQFMMDAVMDEAEKRGEPDASFVGFDRVHVIVKEKGNVD
jgi:hypothetical protein